jgi:HAD superfamily phosphoserine phosphatase-like hydrolase
LDARKGPEGKLNDLIVFDVEGVLIPKRRFLLFEAAKKLSLLKFAHIAVLGFLYEIGLLSLESALGRIFGLLRGVTIEDLFQLYKRLPLIPGVKEVFTQLNERGYRTALISSGLPTVLVEDLAARLRADYAVGLKLDVVSGYLTGQIAGEVLKPGGKARVLRKIMEKEGVSPRECIAVADDRNNLPMFPLCRLRIGYNPDFVLSIKSDFVVNGDLTEILPVMQENVAQTPKIPSRRDLFRESIHMGSFLVPLVCKYLLNSCWVSLLILIVTLLYGLSEFARLRGTDVPIFSTITWKATTKAELHEFTTAPIYFSVGIMLSLVLFPEPISYVSIAILTLGDGSATIFGKILGRTVLPFNKGKRLEASILGFFFASAGAMFFVTPAHALLGALIGMLMESLPLPLSDNITIPLASGLVLMAIL